MRSLNVQRSKHYYQTLLLCMSRQRRQRRYKRRHLSYNSTKARIQLPASALAAPAIKLLTMPARRTAHIFFIDSYKLFSKQLFFVLVSASYGFFMLFLFFASISVPSPLLWDSYHPRNTIKPLIKSVNLVYTFSFHHLHG